MRQARLRSVAEGLTRLRALQHARPLGGDQHHLLARLRAPGHLLLELHDQLLVAGEEVPPGPGVADGVGGEGHAVVEVSLCRDVLQWQTFYVAVRVTVGEDVHSLVSHLLDQVLQFHGNVDDSLHWRFVAAGELDERHQAWLQGELCLNGCCAEGDDGPVGGVGSELPALKGKVGEPEGGETEDAEMHCFEGESLLSLVERNPIEAC